MIRVMIVDDQAVVRAGVTRILGPDDGFEVVAECEDGDEVVARVTDHHPDLVLMDIRMRRVDGVSAIQALVDAGDPPPVLVLTTFDDDGTLAGRSRRRRRRVHPQGRLGRDSHRGRSGGRRRRGVARCQRHPPCARCVPDERPAANGRSGSRRPADRS